MKIFLDTADLSEIRRAAEAGLIDGVTTNPFQGCRLPKPFVWRRPIAWEV